MKKKRLFIAIPLPDYIKEILTDAAQITENAQIKWVPKENLHITLLFLGNTDENRLPEIIGKIEEITSQCAIFSLDFKELLTIVKNGKPIMIWAEFLEHEQFKKLVELLCKFLCHQDTKAQSSTKFFKKPDHKPRPHVTLARIKRSTKYKGGNTNCYSCHDSHANPIRVVVRKKINKKFFRFSTLEIFKLEVVRIELWESVLEPKQAVYKMLRSFELLATKTQR